MVKALALERKRKIRLRELLSQAELEAALMVEGGELDAERREREARTHRAKALRLLSCERGMWGRSRVDRGFIVRPGGALHAQQISCDHRLCPTCARRRAAMYRERLTVYLHGTGRADRYNRHLTLTQKAFAGESLSDALERFVARWDKFRRRKFFRELVDGAICAFEVTRNVEQGWWHVHAHVLLDSKRMVATERWVTEWRRGHDTGWAHLQGAGEYYKRKHGRKRPEDADPLGSSLGEVVKYITKGMDLVDDAALDDDAPPLPGFATGAAARSVLLLREACLALNRFRMLRTYGTARGASKDDVDEQRVLEEKALEKMHQQMMQAGYVGWNLNTGDLVSNGLWQWYDDDETVTDAWSAEDRGARVETFETLPYPLSHITPTITGEAAVRFEDAKFRLEHPFYESSARRLSEDRARRRREETEREAFLARCRLRPKPKPKDQQGELWTSYTKKPTTDDR